MPRDERHFDELARLLELERNEERRRLGELHATLPLNELEARGLVVLDLESKEERTGLGGRQVVSFVREDSRPLRATLAPGDMVSVAPRKAEVQNPPRALVVKRNRSMVELAFDKPPPSWIFEGRLRLDVLTNDVSFERTKAALLKVKGLEHGTVRRRREVLLGREAPRFEEKDGEFEPRAKLNPEQTLAVSKALAAQDFFLVHGPPGTGKSHVLAELAVQAVARGQRVLCTAASNAAVDHLLELCLDRGLVAVRVGHPARVMERLQEHTLDVLVENHPDRVLARELFEEGHGLLGYARKQRDRGRSRERFSNAREAKKDAYQLFDEARVLEKKAVKSVLDRAQVLCVTCTSLDRHEVRDLEFELALVDEATQATEPVTLRAFLASPKVVLAGDPFQLPPTVMSQEAEKRGLGKSLFERLLEEHGEGTRQLLREQHRMHEQLMAFPNVRVYSGQLRAHPSVANRTLAGLSPFVFVDTAGKGFEEQQLSQDASIRNEGEGELIVNRARALLAAGLPARELAIITPYKAQALWLADKLADVADLEVDTVDAFQGREKDVVLVSLVRTNAEQQVGFLADVRRMNVALTRARMHLWVAGDSATLSGHPFYAALVEHAQATGAWRSAWEM